MTPTIAELREEPEAMYSHRGDGIPTQFVNPDGPEAVAAVDALLDRIEKLEAGLREHDAAVAKCPFTRRVPPDPDKPCPSCGASSSESCGRQVGASFAFVGHARTLLTKDSTTKANSQ